MAPPNWSRPYAAGDVGGKEFVLAERRKTRLSRWAQVAWVLGNAPTSHVSTCAYVNPGLAALLGWLLLDEPITLRMVIAVAAITPPQ